MKKLRIALISAIAFIILFIGFALAIRSEWIMGWPTGRCWEMPMRWDKNINGIARNITFKIPFIGWASIGRQGNLIYCDVIEVGEGPHIIELGMGFLPTTPEYRCSDGFWFTFDKFDRSYNYEYFGTLDRAVSPISFEDCVERMKDDGLVVSYGLPTTQIPKATSVAKATLPTELVSTPNSYLIVDQSHLKMYAMDNDEVIRTILISTGADGYDTPAWEGMVGAERTYFNTVDGQIADIGWKLFYARVGWIMIHTVPYTYKDYVGMEKIYHGLDALGSYRLSGGCIWVSDQDALWLQSWGVVGVPITIFPKE